MSVSNFNEFGSAHEPGGYFHLVIRGKWGCTAGWGRIFTTGLTIMESHFQLLLEWCRTFSDFWVKTVLFTRMFVLQVKSKVLFIQYKEHT